MEITPGFTAPRKLTPEDHIKGFRSGNDLVDQWIAMRASNAAVRGTAVVYASFSDGLLAGFYSISAHALQRDAVAGGWLKRNAPAQIPAILLGMLGVDERFQHQHLGAMLLENAIKRSLGISAELGARALIVDPVDDAARAFYERYGFVRIPGTARLYLPLKPAR